MLSQYVLQVLVLQWLICAHARLQSLGPSIRRTFEKVGYYKAWDNRVQHEAVKQVSRLYPSQIPRIMLWL
jgi:hypothetical protein